MALLSQEIVILMVDDDEIDVKAAKRAFHKAGIANPVLVARDGWEALEVVRGGHEHPPLPRPYLILLDITMPRMNGLELLAELRADEDLRDAVVFILTTSAADQDLVEAYRLNVAGYMSKSNVAGDLLAKAELIDRYLNAVELPRSST